MPVLELAPGPRAKVIVCDDSSTIRGAIVRILSERYECVPVCSAEEALDSARHVRPDLVVCDVVMGGMTGFDFGTKPSGSPASSQFPSSS